jgi:opacity protein-like surface antigen
MRLPLLSLAVAASAFAQPVSVGIRAGMPLTDFVSTVQNQFSDFYSNTRPYILGPTIEFRLPAGLGIELDALYRRLNYSGTVGLLTDDFYGTPAVIGTAISSTSADAWEFPLLLKYRFHVPVVKPYVDAGFAWDTLAGLKQSIRQTVGAITNNSTTSTPADLSKKGTSGFVIGAGLDIHAVVMHLSPEVRYTHWGAAHFEDPAGLVKSNQSQAEFLLGITF